MTSVCDETDLMLTICLPSKFVNSRKHQKFIYRDITIYLVNYKYLNVFFIYNVLPGTTSAAGVKAAFLKEIILGEAVVEEISPAFAFEQLSHMKGGPSIKV